MTQAIAPVPAAQESHSQVVKVQLQLRERILAGELAAGERIAELAIVQRLGISRTPIREALMRLEQEGMLEAVAGGRGYRVRVFSEADVSDAIELRGTLEGLAARMAAERGVDERLMAQALRCLDAIDRVLDAPGWGDQAFSRYVALNSEFHDQLLAMSGSAFMQRELERVKRLPFASPSGFVIVRSDSPRAHHSLILAQEQHRQVLEAIEQREGARAEALMKEHSRIARRNLREAMRAPEAAGVPGAQLIRAGR
ncbi:GntR family transcriptional regulator [Comamonas composti]|uniref:GntR family transcriptional regulator n=1 Tax=Comamonas composti TaxID=408558 RepID=UPI0003F958ED|nr:GntR family transcriptional regulator [Comamonas composti]